MKKLNANAISTRNVSMPIYYTAIFVAAKILLSEQEQQGSETTGYIRDIRGRSHNSYPKNWSLLMYHSGRQVRPCLFAQKCWTLNSKKNNTSYTNELSIECKYLNKCGYLF